MTDALQVLLDRAYWPAGFAIVLAGLWLALAARSWRAKATGLALAHIGAAWLLVLAAGAGDADALSAAWMVIGVSPPSIALIAALAVQWRDCNDGAVEGDES